MTDRSVTQNDIEANPVVLYAEGHAGVPSAALLRPGGPGPVAGRGQVQAFDVLADDRLRQGIKEFSNWPTVPQLYVQGEFVGGCDIVARDVPERRAGRRARSKACGRSRRLT